MRTRLATLSSGVLLATVGSLAVAAPASAVVCDAYSRTCVQPSQTVRTPPPSSPPAKTEVLSRTTVRSTSTPSTLPFTGGELVLLSTAGAAAVAGGVGLVVAGRRRRAEQPAE